VPDGPPRHQIVLCVAAGAWGCVARVRDLNTPGGRPAPRFPLRDLTAEELRYNEGQPEAEHFVKYEVYPELPTGQSGARGRLWTQAELDSVGKGCGAVTSMPRKIAETYAREPGFYGSTFCVRCGTYRPVGEDGEFVWLDGARVGTLEGVSKPSETPKTEP
jgi:hypothetical protein